MLGLDQEVGCQQHWIGRTVGDHHALGRPEDHPGVAAPELAEDLGGLDGGASGTDHHPDPGYRLGAEGEGGDPGRPVGPEDLVDPKLGRDGQHRRVDLPASSGDWRHDHRDLGNSRHGCRGTELDQDRGEGSLAARDEQAGAGDRGRLLADLESGRYLGPPLPTGDQLVVEGPGVGDRGPDRLQQLGRDPVRSRGDLGRVDREGLRGDLDPVELGQGLGDRHIAPFGDLFDQAADRLEQLGVEDPVPAAIQYRGPLGLPHLGPPPDPE